ncbi:MAG: hypothetical protein DRJ97_00370 [Thermoprotei archaeon]|nr:MAG: hypothetical protein DRJ97_00370 [Thermoprotei archaeon]
MRRPIEALSLIKEALTNREAYFSRGSLNSEGRKLIARLLRILVEDSPLHYRRLKRLYPWAAEDRWVEALNEVLEDLSSISEA